MATSTGSKTRRTRKAGRRKAQDQAAARSAAASKAWATRRANGWKPKSTKAAPAQGRRVRGSAKARTRKARATRKA